MHYYKRNIGDYHKKAGRLNLLQHGVYTILMDAIYDRETFPTKQEAIDWCWASTPEEITAVEFVLTKFFVNGDGIYRQKRMVQEIESYTEFCEQQTEKGKKGGRPKGTNKPNGLNKEPNGLINKPNDNPIEPELTLTTNHKPDRLNPKPIYSPDGEGGNSKSSPIPYQKIVDSYHTNFPIGPKVKLITDKRKRSIKARWANGGNGLDFWDDYFKHAAKSRFLTGNNDRNWIADFDFFIRPDTSTYMQEGKYHK